MMDRIFANPQMAQELGLLVIRVGIGLTFIKSGWDKLKGGTQTWQWLGEQMKFFGITFLPVAWGLMAASAEFLGGIALVAGLFTRVAAFFLSDVMIVALVMHVNSGDPYRVYSFPLSLLIVFFGLMIAGGGAYALT